MTRAHATALTLVNWKGVFFERYALDRHVTALEGANGAGKTTVMVAAYVVLLPDLTRLKFTNLGETGATGGDRGIYGRLGEPGPSYAALDVDVGDGSRIVAGVHIERKAAPALSLTPFVLSEGPEPLAGDRVFLHPTELHEEVRTLKELAQAVKAAGGTLTTFPSSKEYFAYLFERGISPLRLGSDEERSKFNEMLRTSMTGGISRTLTSELRSFLLERESGLFDTLGRMRKNLEACRRTRLEVAEARVLEQEISGIYTAGEAMFSAALDASRKEALESRQALERVEAEWQSAHARARELETQAREAELAKSGLSPRLERARGRDEVLRERGARLERAYRARGRVLEVEAALARALPEAEAALQRKADWTRLRQCAKQERDQAQAARGRAAAGLASLQVGLEELHRRAHAFRRARQELEGARRAHGALLLDGAANPDAAGNPDAGQALEPVRQLFAAADALESAAASDAVSESGGLSSELLAGAARAVRDLRDQLDRELAEQERRAAATEQRRRDHAEACLALHRVSGGARSEQPAQQARQELGRLNELELLGARAPELALEARRLATLAEKRTALTVELAALGLSPLPSARGFADELAALESAARSCERAQHQRQAAASQAAEQAAAARARRPALLARADRHRQLLRVLGRLQARQELAPTSRKELETRLGDLDQQRELARDEAAHWSRERRAAWDAARELEAAGENLQAALLALAERVEGELLAQRYEDLDLDTARRVEAELGPLSRAIVVDDPWRAAGSLLEQPSELECVWLLRAGAAWPLGAHAASASPPQPPSTLAAPPAEHAVVDLGYGLRVTRLPATVSLGRAARARRIEELRALAERLSHDIEASEARQRVLLEARRDLELLGQDWELWELGDPAPDLERCRADEANALEARAQAEAEARRERLEAARIDARLAALRAHLSDHHLLDLPDVASQAARARVVWETARGARAELERVQDARQSLARLLHSLDEQPTSNDGAADTARRLSSRRDHSFSLGEALAALESTRHAWGWAHAERALSERTELVPELEAQHTAARLELELAQAGFERSELEWEGATALAQEQSARLAALQAHLERASAELNAEGIDDASEAALEQARAEIVRSGHELEQLAAEVRGVDAELALRGERAQQAELAAQAVERALLAQRQRGEPLEQRWRDFAERARDAGVFEPGPLADADAAAASSRRWLEAQAKRALLADRLEAARGAAGLAARACRAAPGAGMELAADYLELWLETRQWLLARLPAPLGALGEPLLGLARLRADLGELEGRLDRQEGDLRGTSGDVARSIEVQVRRAAARVRRLNRALEGVSFGSIAAIRVQLDRVAKMDGILRALREGETQELLFQSNLPLEEALDEIFRRHAGGRGGGQRLVDYREYLELSVQIQRQTSASWERVNPSQVSTGEAIGVGAALMMVILAEWEREDQLLQRERKLGSLRFLFLDEANRLSKDNLAVLFELCRTLDLQLLIAAPEVAHAEGNTTYHLLRRVSAEGREQVFVTGRRASLPAAPALRPSGLVPAEPALAQQLPLVAV